MQPAASLMAAFQNSSLNHPEPRRVPPRRGFYFYDGCPSTRYGPFEPSVQSDSWTATDRKNRPRGGLSEFRRNTAYRVPTQRLKIKTAGPSANNVTQIQRRSPAPDLFEIEYYAPNARPYILRVETEFGAHLQHGCVFN